MAASARPGELDLDAKWDRCIDVTLRRGVYGALAGAASAAILFRESPPRRTPPARLSCGGG